MNNQNPFGDILAQMNQAQNAYNQTIAGLQQQMQAARQQAAAMFQNPMAPNVPAAPQNPVAAPAPEVPQNIQQLTALGEIRSAIEKSNENQAEIIKLLASFIGETPKKDITPKKPKDNETPEK